VLAYFQSEDNADMRSFTCSVLCNILSYMMLSSVGHQFASNTLPTVLSDLLQRAKDKVAVLHSFAHSFYFHLIHYLRFRVNVVSRQHLALRPSNVPIANPR